MRCVSPYATLAHVWSLSKGEVCWVPVGWPPPPSIEVPVHMPGSSDGVSVRHPGRVGCPAKTCSVNAFWHRVCHRHLASEDLMSDYWHFEGCTHLLGQLLHILHTQYCSQLLPPVGCIQLAGPPFQPLLLVSY